MSHSGIRYRFYRELILFALLLIAVMAPGVVRVYFLGVEDAARLSFIDAARAALENPEHHQLSNRSNHLRVWLRFEDIPGETLQLFPEERMRDNVMLAAYEYAETASAPEDATTLTAGLFRGTPERIHFLMPYVSESGERAWVSHFTDPREYASRTNQKAVMQAATIAPLILLGIFIWFARRFSNLLLQPLKAISQFASRIDDPKTDLESAVLTRGDEFGDVARALRDSISRLREYNLREKKFLRSASHELRTPVAVISSALDVVAQRQKRGNSDMQRPLQDIERSADEIKQIIDALLWIARYDEQRIEPQSVNLRTLIDEIVNNHQLLFVDKSLQFNLQIPDDIELHTEEPLLRIVIANFVRNACEHMTDGEITLQADTQALLVVNPIAQGDNPTTEGFGFGQTIVREVANKLGYEVLFSAEDGHWISTLRYSDLR